MTGTAAAMPRPRRRRLARGLRWLAVAVAAHGLVLWLFAAARDFLPAASDAAGALAFWVLAVPALMLTLPFTSILWRLGLMNAPGWIAWPKPLGFALAYAVWIVALLGLAWAVGARPGNTEPEGRQQ